MIRNQKINKPFNLFSGKFFNCLFATVVFLMKEIFIVLSAFFLTLLFLEDLKPYFVTTYINLRTILFACIIFGIITLLTSRYREKIKFE